MDQYSVGMQMNSEILSNFAINCHSILDSYEAENDSGINEAYLLPKEAENYIHS